ncbi:MAG: hypothetical protein FWG93_03475 [Oscillospiraceae bacterium]|nr:hypothetical protein [Oscillospiraceae bacterium]
MKNERLLASIGNIADQHILEAQPKATRGITPFKPAVLAAAIAAFALLCGFTVYVMTGGDLWIQKPSSDPAETVRSAIENQAGKDYAIRIAVERIEIDEAETARVVERFISGTIAERRGWSEAYLAEHFIVVKAIYYAEYDRAQTTRSDGKIVQYFYLTRDIDSGKWTIVDNSGNVHGPDELAGDSNPQADINGDTGPENSEVISVQEQIISYLSELFTQAYVPYYDGLRYGITGYEETILDGECTATFLWTMYFLGKAWDLPSDEGVEQEANFFLQATAPLINGMELDVSTMMVLADASAVGPANYSTPIEEIFPDQVSK